jgi:hypothetical protein
VSAPPADDNPPSPDDEREYPIAPSPESKRSTTPVVEQAEAPCDEPPPQPERFQFSLAELFAMMATVAVFLSVVNLLPGENRVAVFAGALGLAVLLGMIALDAIGVRRPIVRVAWWAGLALYLLACLAAWVRGA